MRTQRNLNGYIGYRVLLILISIFLALALIGLPNARGVPTINVPGDYPDLQTAIDNENNVIINIVEDQDIGTLKIINKNITIRGAGGKIIISVVSIVSTDGIYIRNSSVWISDLEIIMSPFKFGYVRAIVAEDSNITLNRVNTDLPIYKGTQGLYLGRGTKAEIKNVSIHADYGIVVIDDDPARAPYVKTGPFLPVDIIGRDITLNVSEIGMFFLFQGLENIVDISNFLIRQVDPKSQIFGDILIYYYPYERDPWLPLPPRPVVLDGRPNKIFLSDGILIHPYIPSYYGIYGDIYGGNTSVVVKDLIIYDSITGIEMIVNQYNVSLELQNIEMYVSNIGINIYEIEVRSILNPLTNNFSLVMDNISIYGEPDYGWLPTTGIDINFITRGYRVINDFNILLDNVDVSGFPIGIQMNLADIGKKRIWIENYRYWDRDGVGLNMWFTRSYNNIYPIDPTSIESIEDLRLSEDIYIAYSILWSFIITYKPYTSPVLNESIILFETVYDESGSVSYGFDLVSIWSLETLVLSSVLDLPLQNIYVSYQTSYGEVSGYTDHRGIFRYRFTYSFVNNPLFTTNIFVLATGSPSSSTWYTSYVGDSITMPYWYGRIVLYLDILAFKAIGYSHRTGTTMLIINGYNGMLYTYNSYTPDELVHLNNEGSMNSQETFLVTVYRYYDFGRYVIVYTEIYFLGEWLNWILVIDTENKLLYSPGPIDLRATITTI